MRVFVTAGGGVGALMLTPEGKVVATPEPFSRPIQKLINRINWNSASISVAAYHNNRYYLAVPLDGSTENNAILVYDFLRKAWWGHWEGDLVSVRDFFIAKYNGTNRLFFTSDDGYICMTEEGYEDETRSAIAIAYKDVLVKTLPSVGDTIRIGGGTTVTVTASATNTATTWGCETLATARTNLYIGYSVTGWTDGTNTVTQTDHGIRVTSANATAPVVTITGTWSFVDSHSGTVVMPDSISDDMTTRGYICGTDSHKEFAHAQAQISTWSPSYSLSTIVDGVGENKTLISSRTKSRRTYYTHNKADWVETNINDDHATAFRQDYSIILNETGIYFDSGVNPDQHQEITEKVRCKSKARYLQLRFTNSQGRLAIRSTSVYARAGARTMGIRV
jgi:hypothetical protein